MAVAKYELQKLGEVELQAIYSFSKVGKIAGFIVKDGVIKPQRIGRVIRNKKVVGEGTITSLKTGKDDTKERRAGQEGGLTIEGFNDFEVGDIVECFEKVRIN